MPKKIPFHRSKPKAKRRQFKRRDPFYGQLLFAFVSTPEAGYRATEPFLVTESDLIFGHDKKCGRQCIGFGSGRRDGRR